MGAMDAMGPDHDELLLDIAQAAIDLGLGLGAPPSLHRHELPAPLDQPCGAFVTLTVDGRLNGCIGAIETSEPLAACIARLARSAAFDDPRLPVLRSTDRPRLGIAISLLSPLEPIDCADRAGLVAAVRPGIHGLVLGAGRHQGVFLPDVWAQLPDPDDFIEHLLAKAGLRPWHWPVDVQAWRFTTRKLARAAGSAAGGAEPRGRRSGLAPRSAPLHGPTPAGAPAVGADH